MSCLLYFINSIPYVLEQQTEVDVIGLRRCCLMSHYQVDVRGTSVDSADNTFDACKFKVKVSVRDFAH